MAKFTGRVVNHIVYVLDVSGSMDYHLQNARRVLESSLENIKQTLKNTGIEGLFSLYVFSNNVQRLLFDEPIESVNLKNITFRANGSTSLIDATLLPILEGAKTQVNRKGSENHSYLLNIITDGEENSSKANRNDLVRVIEKLNDEWTLAIQVPNMSSVYIAKTFGFPAGNIQVWNTTSQTGLEESARDFSKGYALYASNVADSATRGLSFSSKGYYTPDMTTATRASVKSTLTPIKGHIYHAQSGPHEIRDFVEKYTGKPYNKGSAFYELLKTEDVQPYKELVVVNKNDTSLKYGGAAARQVLGLPATHCKVTPGDHGEWRIFIQSTSVNRKIQSGTSVFVKE